MNSEVYLNDLKQEIDADVIFELKKQAHVTITNIAEIERKILQNTEIASNIRADLKSTESRVLAIITNERDENGKPIYSNETARKVELERRLSLDDFFVRDQKNAEKAEILIRQYQITVDVLKRQFSLEKIYFEHAALGRRSGGQ